MRKKTYPQYLGERTFGGSKEHSIAWILNQLFQTNIIAIT